MASLPCPHLPGVSGPLNYRHLRQHREANGERLYYAALEYGQWLWLQELPARAILALARGLYAEVPCDAAILSSWPLPYAAIHWICQNRPQNRFLGNPRISFQHQASRIRGPRWEQRRARAWAAWSVCAHALPKLADASDIPHPPPRLEVIQAALRQHGVPDEERVWAAALVGAVI